MRVFQTQDIKVKRLIEWSQMFPLFNEDGSYVPIAEVSQVRAYITSTNQLDGPVIAELPTDIADDVNTSVIVTIPEAASGSLTADSSEYAPAGYWWLIHIDQDGERIPHRCGKILTL